MKKFLMLVMLLIACISNIKAQSVDKGERFCRYRYEVTDTSKISKIPLKVMQADTLAQYNDSTVVRKSAEPGMVKTKEAKPANLIVRNSRANIPADLQRRARLIIGEKTSPNKMQVSTNTQMP